MNENIKNKYPWLINIYKNIIDFYRNANYNNLNFIVTYKCNLNVNILILNFVKWVFCINKLNYDFCNKCLNCNLLEKNIHPNFIFISNKYNEKLDISFIRKINYLLFNNLNINLWKIIYFDNFLFNNFYINNFLLKIIEEPFYNSILIFSCLENIFIPNNIFSRLYKFKIYIPNEKNIFFWLNKNYDLKKINYNSIISAIRLSNNSPLDSICLLKKYWNLRLILLNKLINIKNIKLIDFINLFNNNYLCMNLYWLNTIFFDFIKYKFKKNKYLYNLDFIYMFKKWNNLFCIKKIFSIINKIIDLNNNINNISNINKFILLYEFICYLFLNILN